MLGVLAPFLEPFIEFLVCHLAGIYLGDCLYLCLGGYELFLKGHFEGGPYSVVCRGLAQGSGHKVACPFSSLCTLFKVGECYNPPQFFASLPSLPKAAPSTAIPAPVAAPVIPPISAQPAQPTTQPQPYIKPRSPSPMQVDPANVPLPTLSTASCTTPQSSMSSPPSPRTQRIIQQMQQEAAVLASSSIST